MASYHSSLVVSLSFAFLPTSVICSNLNTVRVDGSARARARAHACVRLCVRVCARACVCVCVCVCV